MKFDTPATTNPIDQLKVVGMPTDRIDGPLKTTGTAPYAYERHDVAPRSSLWLRRRRRDRQGPHHVDRPRRPRRRRPACSPSSRAETPASSTKGNLNTAKLLGGPEIEHYHQAIALVVAETFEQARAAAADWCASTMCAEGGRFDLAAAKDAAVMAGDRLLGRTGDAHVGDFDGAFAAAPVQLDATYTTPDQSHAMMEPHASIAAWDGDKLTLWTSNQMIAWGAGDLAKTLGIPKENVRLISPYIGGGFGGKLFVRSRRAAGRARRAGRGTPGEGRAHAAADVQQHDASPGDHPAHPHRRRRERQDHRHRA